MTLQLVGMDKLLTWVAAYALVGLWALMQWHGKLPSVKSFQEIVATVNSRGGNILWLGAFSLVFFIVSIWFGFWALNKISEGKITTDNAVMGVLLSWLTGSAFGGAFGAMLKTMTGEGSTSRKADYGMRPGDTVGKVTTSLTFSGHNINDTPTA